jgi:uncharacterized repeat protein (TIGR01451 family)
MSIGSFRRPSGHHLTGRTRPAVTGLVVIAVIVAQAALMVGPASAANPAANLDQCANDPLPSSHLDGCNSSATQWVNGNLGASKSVYFEGDSIPYRMTFSSLAFGPTHPHTVTIEWDTTKSSKHAIDYLTTYNRTVANANPCLGVTGCGSPTTFAIPADPQVTGAGVTPIAGNFTMYNGTITSVDAYTGGLNTFVGDNSRRITIHFTSTVANPVLAWGGHISTRQQWGAANSAVAISGSPYHMRLIDLDGSGGNQDRSLSAAAVIFPASITIVKDATPNGSTLFPFIASPSPLTNFSLVDDGTGANTKLFSNITNFQTYTVTENTPSGWTLGGIVCSVTSPNGGSQNVSGATVTIALNEGEDVTCTYSNAPTPAPHLTITKVATEAGFSAVNDVIHYTITATNDGNVTLTNVDVTDSQVSDLVCTPTTPVASLAVGASISCTASHTITQADIDAGSFFNQACVDDGAGGADQACDDVTTPGTQNDVLGLTKTDDLNPAEYDHVGQVVTYTLTATNNGNTTLHNVTVSDAPALDSFTCLPGLPVASLDPGDSVICTGTHSITQADLDAGSFTDTASASSDEVDAPDADDTVTGSAPAPTGQITPTGTTCNQFNDGSASTLDTLLYSVKGGNISQVAPGVFFYWIKVTATAGSNTFTIHQTITTGNYDSHFFNVAAGSNVFTSSCTVVRGNRITQSGADTTITFNASTAGTYIIGVKYDAGSVKGFTAPSPTTVHYDFEIGSVPGSKQGLDLVKKP